MVLMFARVLRGSVGRLLLIGLASSCLSTCSRRRLSERGIGHRGRTEALRANFLVMFGIGIVASWIGVATAALRQRADSSPVTPSQPL